MIARGSFRGVLLSAREILRSFVMIAAALYRESLLRVEPTSPDRAHLAPLSTREAERLISLSNCQVPAQLVRSYAAQYQVRSVLAVYAVDQIKFRNLMSTQERLVMPPTFMKARYGAVE